MKRFAFVLFFVVLALSQTAAPVMAQDSNCTNAPTNNLRVGIWARVVQSPDANNLRQRPSTSAPVLDTMSSHRRFEIVGGPRCSGGLRWWQVRFEGIVGWTADGQGSERWLERLPAETQALIDASANTSTIVPPVAMTATPSPTRNSDCWDAPTRPYLVNGGYAVPNTNISDTKIVYSDTDLTSAIATLSRNTVLSIVSEPVCSGGRRWYQVEFNQVQSGWITDGDADVRYYLRYTPE